MDGFSFLMFASPDEDLLHHQFQHMGFSKSHTHQSLPVNFYTQQDITFITNHTPDSQAASHAKLHGPGACAMGFEVENVEKTYQYVLSHGAKAFEEKGLSIGLPGIEAIGGSVIYLTDANHRPFANQLTATAITQPTAGLKTIDHLTHNVYRGNMDKWADFYQDLFHFRQIRYFDIKGQKTGLLSRAMASENGKIKIPLNESKDDLSQIEEFLKDYHGEGIQHIALHTDDIYQSVRDLKKQGLVFLDTPDTYYEDLTKRIPWHQESIEDLQKLRILMDGEKDPKLGLLLQIFTENTFGPMFFEIIQRKGNEGFGEGNFQALFEAIERDQLRRGVLS